MATVEQRNKKFRLIFYVAGKRYSGTLRTAERGEADAIAGSVDRTLMLLEQGLLEVPDGGDMVSFVLSGGKLTEKPKPPPVRTLADLRDRYLQAHAIGAMEQNSLDTVRMHLRHVIRTFGADFAVLTLTLTHLQGHIERRAKQRASSKRRISAVTLRKELASFRACWNWGVQAGLLNGPFPNKGLKYPKTDEKPPFQTWATIEKQIARGGLNEAEHRDLWNCLFLTLSEIDLVLEFVKANARHPFLYPMFCFAAHTGARRSEMLRLRIDDIDLGTETALLHEKKRARGKRTSRRVPLSSTLVSVLSDWLGVPLQPRLRVLTSYVEKAWNGDRRKLIYDSARGRLSQRPYHLFKNRDMQYVLPIRNWAWRSIRRVRARGEEAMYEGFDATARAAFNFICQGGTADICKLMMLRAQRICQQFGARLLIQIHDELVFEVPQDLASAFIPVMKSVLEEKPRSDFKVPIIVEPKRGFRFGELASVK
jgi:integrase